VDIEEHLRKSQRLVDERRTENALLNRQIVENERRMLECSDALVLGQDAFNFLERVALSRRTKVKGRLESVVTSSLQMAFGDDYRVEFNYAIKNKRSFLDIELVRDTEAGEVRRNMNGFGGSVSDCISVPLRLMVLLASRQTAPVCVLDEAFKHVDPERVEIVAEFLRSIAEDLGLQIILFSHHEVMQDAADAVYVIQDKSGDARVQMEKVATS